MALESGKLLARCAASCQMKAQEMANRHGEKKASMKAWCPGSYIWHLLWPSAFPLLTSCVALCSTELNWTPLECTWRWGHVLHHSSRNWEYPWSLQEAPFSFQIQVSNGTVELISNTRFYNLVFTCMCIPDVPADHEDIGEEFPRCPSGLNDSTEEANCTRLLERAFRAHTNLTPGMEPDVMGGSTCHFSEN